MKSPIDFLLLVCFLLLGYPRTASAYLDPNAGNALVYIAVTLAGVAAYSLKSLFYRLTRKKNFSSDNEAQNDIVIFSEGKKAEMIDINPADRLSARGISHEVLSLSIDEGHGYLRLENDEYFLGTIVTFKNDYGQNEVIDGQQRLWDVDLYNEDGDQLDIFDTGSKNSRTVNLKKGLYYIRVAGETAVSDDGTVTTATGGDYWLLFSSSALSIKRPTVTSVKMKGTESWLYDNYATATVSVKNAGSNTDGFTFRISRSSNMKSGTKKKTYTFGNSGVTRKKIKSSVRMGIYKKYYVQVRGYVTDAFGGRIYGKYSKIKSGALSAKDYNKLK